ncbi:MAG: hypothetical protein HOQ24_00060, partial [Mycobacteriaceae bacterium]|nr:hypothetical protein [Mycobacteriaceae bacterium]
RITAKANELQTQSDVPAASRSARPATGPMAAADPSRSRRSRGTEDRDWPSDRSSRGESQWTGRSRRETPNSRVDPRFPTGGSRHGTPRPDAPSHPTPRYRDGFDR